MPLISAKKHRRPKNKLTTCRLLFGWFALFCLLLFFKNGRIASESIRRGLLLCARTVIPSLFPFMVVSELLIFGGMGEQLIQSIARPFCKLFRLPPAGICAMLLGMLCGFPIGAKALIGAYRKGTISKKDAERAMCVSNLPSPAFILGVVGTSLWKSTQFGIALYASLLSTSMLYGMIDARMGQKKGAPLAEATRIWNNEPENQSIARLFTASIASACGALLSVCAYVVFFSALMGAWNAILESFCAPRILFAALFGALELSGGVQACAALESPIAGGALTAFACAWSGLSVHCQVLSICDGYGLCFRRYFLAKAIQAAICALMFGGILWLFPNIFLA